MMQNSKLFVSLPPVVLNRSINIIMFVRDLVVTMLFVLTPMITSAQSADTIRHDSLPATFAVKTNLLYDAALIPNIGAELYIGGRLTLGADVFYTWLSSDSRHRSWQGYGGYFTVRRYFGRPPKSKHSLSKLLSGHHLGVYVLALTYDVEFGGKGYQADKLGWGGGVEYGYSLPIGRRLNLDFSLGIGYQSGDYKTYEPIDDHYVWQSTNKRKFFGPTKAEVSLKWLLGGKGGSR